MEVNKENIDLMKQLLRTYGKYSKKIFDCKKELEDISYRIKDCYNISGVRYDQPIMNSNPYYNKLQEILNEEGEKLSELSFWENKRFALGLDKLLEMLCPESKQIIDMHYFQELSISFITTNKQFKYEEATKRKINKIVKFLVKKY